jgi:N-methylhydantoinase A
MRIAFDTGGTITDCIFLRGGRLEILKVPSTPGKPADAIAHALDRIRESAVELAGLELVCGTTVGTNAHSADNAAMIAAAAYPHLLAGNLAPPDLNAEPNLRLA